MQVPLSWLREYTAVPANSDATDVMDVLVKVGLEEEGVIDSGLSGPIVVGQVLSIEPEEQKNGKVINWCQVDVGENEPRGVVCGAHNFKVGDKVAVCLPGAVLPGDFQITPRKTYGHLSDGMLAAAGELGLDSLDLSDGIIIFSDVGLDPEVGASVTEVLGINDQAAEINVTPDRGYCFSLRGVAREYNHGTNIDSKDHIFLDDSYVDPVFSYDGTSIKTPPDVGKGYPARIDDHFPLNQIQGVDRYITETVRGIDSQAKTPQWITRRLELAGIRPISLIVDVTNYVMLDTGQPLHAYDADKLSGDIVVRRANSSKHDPEVLITLDGKERILNPEDLVISDNTGPIGLAGVMGGHSTEVDDSTQNVVIEAAHFDPVTISRSARRHKIPSEASKRFIRGVDPTIQENAAHKAALFLEEYGKGQLTDEVTIIGGQPAQSTIFLEKKYPQKVVGIDYDPVDIIGALEAIGAIVEQTDRNSSDSSSGWNVTVPPWRPDLVDAASLVEEIARLIGYDKIPSSGPQLPAQTRVGGYTPAQDRFRKIKDYVASTMTEVQSYPFVSEETNALFDIRKRLQDTDGVQVPQLSTDNLNVLKLANALSLEYSTLRTNLLGTLIPVAQRNIARGFKDVDIFETGRVFIPHTRCSVDAVHEQEIFKSALDGYEPPTVERPVTSEMLENIDHVLPAQPVHIAGVFSGTKKARLGHSEGPYTYEDALDAVKNIAHFTGTDLKISQGQLSGFHPGRTGFVTLDQKCVGIVGQLHPQVNEKSQLAPTASAFELDMSTIVERSKEFTIAQQISSQPRVRQDIALVVSEEVPAEDIKDQLVKGAGELLEDIQLFDHYQGQGVDPGQKSLAFSLSFRDPERTLTHEEVSHARQNALSEVQKKYNAQMRG